MYPVSMFRSVIVLCFLLLWRPTGHAQQAAPADTDKALLWKISGKGLKQPSYLFGTIHMICENDYTWTPEMEQVLKGAKKVALELDMDDPELQTNVAAGLILEGKTLKDFYSAEDYSRLSDYAEKNNLPLAMMQQIKPFAIMALLYAKVLPCDVPFSYESKFVTAAQEQHVEVVGLESVKDQLDVFDHMNQDSAAHQLLDMLVHMDSAKAEYGRMLAAYNSQDLPALYSLVLESPDYKDDLDMLLFDRNRKWIPGIEKMAAQQATFIAVGAGHLWGDKGVIALLRKKGYTVTPVRARP